MEVFRDIIYVEDVCYRNIGGVLMVVIIVEEGIIENGVNILVQVVVINVIRNVLGFVLFDIDMGIYISLIILDNESQRVINEVIGVVIELILGGDNFGNYLVI